MKPIGLERTNSKKNGYHSDDDNVRYKINTNYMNNIGKLPSKQKAHATKVEDEDDGVRYKFPTALTKTKTEHKTKPKPKIKVNFWSNKQTVSRLHNAVSNVDKTKRRHTVADTVEIKPKSSVKVRKRVSFLPSPLFNDNHAPMVTVPDDLTIQLNEEEAHDLREDLNEAFVNSNSGANKSNGSPKRKSRSSVTQTSPKALNKRKHSSIEDADLRTQGNENELEFFSKYVVQKLRKMETNQRIYSENLINTVLMLGQLGKLNVKSKIADV